MKTPVIVQREPLQVQAGVSKLTKVRFARSSQPVLMKEPAQFWDEVYIANEAYILAEVTHPRVRRRLAYDAAIQRLFWNISKGQPWPSWWRPGSRCGNRLEHITCC